MLNHVQNQDHFKIDINENINEMDSKPVDTISIIDKTSIQTPKHSFELTIDKIDITDLSCKKTLLVKNITIFIKDMNSFKLQVNLDWKSVAKEMECVWINYTKDITNCEKEYSNICILYADKVKTNQKIFNTGLTKYKAERAKLNDKISKINASIVNVKERHGRLNKLVTAFKERVENTKIYSKNEIILNG